MKKGDSTKRNIAEAFKTLMKTDDFESITITDITNECDLNRLTFYYHFKDKFDLLKWIFYNDVINPIRDTIDVVNWDERLKGVLEEMRKNKEYYDKIISYEKLDFWNYIYEVAKEIMAETLTALYHENMEGEHLKFSSYFFAFGLSGTIYDWAASGMKESPEELTGKIVALTQNAKEICCQMLQAEREK